MERLAEHRERGDRRVLPSACPAVYLRPRALREGFATVLATALELVDDRFTGHLETRNCRGRVKARRVRDRLSAHASHQVVSAYGDGRSDPHMLALADHAWKSGRRTLPPL